MILQKYRVDLPFNSDGTYGFYEHLWEGVGQVE